jgi:hypothetical protein
MTRVIVELATDDPLRTQIDSRCNVRQRFLVIGNARMCSVFAKVVKTRLEQRTVVIVSN